jgi:predicted nucleic acid-binding OB-fold protein
MSKRRVKKPRPNFTADMLVKAVTELKEMNEKVINAVEIKLLDFHNKLNDLNTRISYLEKKEGVTNGSRVPAETANEQPGPEVPTL